MNADPEAVDVAIIGAGWYGLVAARTYVKLRPAVNLVVLDTNSSVRGVWSARHSYPNLVAQVKLGLFNYTDTPMPGRGRTKNDMVTGTMIHDYLQRYAEDHDIMRRIRFNSFVRHASKTDQGWRLSIRNLQESDILLDTAKLLVCTGVTSIPSMPKMKTIDPSIPIIHSRDLGAAFHTLGKDNIQTVVVVGAAKSAYDAVYLLLSMGKRVIWLIRPKGAGPLAILPAELLGYFNSIAVASTRLMTYLSPSILNTDDVLYRFFQKLTIGRWCTGKMWDAIACLSDYHAGYASGDHVSQLRPEVDRRRQRGSHSRFDRETKTDLGIPTLGGELSSDGPQPDSKWEKYDLDADKIVNERHPFLANPPQFTSRQTNNVQPSKRWRLYRRAIPLSLADRGDRSLAIMGQIHTVQTPLVSEIRSFWSILHLLGELDLPDYDTMAREVAEWNAWTRKRYLSQGQKFPYLLYDFLPYVDTFCRDLGINTQRKHNILPELFEPYKPGDFNGLWVSIWQKNA